MSEFDRSGSVQEERVEELEEENVKRIFGARNYGIVSIFLGVCLVAASLPLTTDLENYNNLRAPLIEAKAAIGDKLVLPYYIIISGFLIIVGGSVSLCGYFGNSRFWTTSSVIVNVLSCALAVFLAFESLNTLDNLLKRLASNPVSDPNFGELEISVMDFVGAVFNECCMTEYDSRDYRALGGPNRDSNGDVLDDNQRPVPECLFTGNVLDTCPQDMFPPIVSTALQGLESEVFQDLLCHCYTNVAMYDDFVDIFQRRNTCQQLRSVVIHKPDDVELPVVKQTFRQLVSFLGFSRPELADELPIRKFALVGKFLPPAQLYDEPAERIGWSCGMGFAKNLAQYMYLYVSDRTRPLVIGGLVIGFLEGCISILLLFLWIWDYFYPHTDEDEYDYLDDGYGQPQPRKKKQSTFANVARKASKALRGTNPGRRTKPGRRNDRKPSAATQPVGEVKVPSDVASANPSEQLSSLLGQTNQMQVENRSSLGVAIPKSPAAATVSEKKEINLDDHL